MAEGSKPKLYFRHASCLAHNPGTRLPGHPDAPRRLIAIEERLAGEDWLGWEVREAPAAERRTVELVHAPTHVEAIRRLSLEGGGAIDPDTYAGPSSYDAALHATGAACEMARALLAGEAAMGFCGVRPAGHHATADRAMGFCLFNHVAVAAELAIRELGARRVFILDWDVHHGNGTADIFRRRDDVLFASIHQGDIYPGSGPLSDVGAGPGEGYTINLPAPAGSEEEIWLSLLEHVALPAAAAFEPDLVLISAGFDAHRDDPLGGCRLETESFARMARHVREMAAKAGAPVGAVLEGGYSPAALADSVRATLAALGGEGEAVPAAPDAMLTSRAAAHVGHYWHL